MYKWLSLELLLPPPPIVISHFRDRLLFFIGGGLPFLGLADNFFKSNAFQKIFFITFCNENNFFMIIFKKHYRLFYRSYLKKITSCACIHMKSLIRMKQIHPE